jgi:hypothetical protein
MCYFLCLLDEIPIIIAETPDSYCVTPESLNVTPPVDLEVSEVILPTRESGSARTDGRRYAAPNLGNTI